MSNSGLERIESPKLIILQMKFNMNISEVGS